MTSPPAPPLLSLSQVTAGYGEVPILRGISLTVGEGEIVALIGANGAGKTTTLMTICGIVPDISADSKIEFGGESLLRLSPDQIAARGICQSPEGRRIFPDLSVQENLEMGAYLRREFRRRPPRLGLRAFAFSNSEKTAAAGRRDAFRRRAANARHFARAGGESKIASA